MKKNLKTRKTSLFDFCRERFWRWITRPIDYWYWRPKLISFCKKHNILRCDSGSYRQLYGITVSYRELLEKLKRGESGLSPLPPEMLKLLK